MAHPMLGLAEVSSSHGPDPGPAWLVPWVGVAINLPLSCLNPWVCAQGWRHVGWKGFS